MARPESVALGGFFPCPPELFDPIASTVRVSFDSSDHTLLLADPCAGEGYAIRGLAERWVTTSGVALPDEKFTPHDRWNHRCKVFACEMEQTRAHRLYSNLGATRYGSRLNECEKGDAFLLLNQPGEGVHVLWHNPPYDVDRQFGRLEERWLRRFAPLVAVGGAFLHFVPFYALSASAESIARHFDRVACYRMSAPYFDAFEQVVLVARRRLSLAAPEPSIVARVRAWSEDAASIPELPIEGLRDPVVLVSTEIPAKPPTWQRRETDVLASLASYEPWTYTDRGGRRLPTPNVEPEAPYTEIMVPRLRLACPPRPAHIAMAAGAGVLSGARLTPDPGQRGPELLLKGVHRRTFRHLRWKENAKGERMAEERQHHPELQLSILDLSTGRYHTLTSTIEPSEPAHNDPSRWTVGDLLVRYSASMLRAMRERCDLLYDPTRPGDKVRELPAISPTPLVGGQEDGVRALLRLLQEPDRTAILLGEIGVGKTRMSLTAAYHHLRGRGRVFVICPTALLPEWQSEVEKVLPGTRVTILENVIDVDALAARPCDGFEVVLMSKEQAKLGHEWEGVSTCPRCGTHAKDGKDKLAETRAFCEQTITRPGNAAARIFARLVPLAGVFANSQLRDVVERIGGRIARRMKVREGADWHRLDYVVRPVVAHVRRALARTTGHDLWDTWRTILQSLLHALGDDDLIVETALSLFRSTLTDRDTTSDYGQAALLRTIAAEMVLLLPPSSPLIGATLAEMERYDGARYDGRKGRLFTKGRAILLANMDRRMGKWTKETAQKHALGTFGCNGDTPVYLSEPRGSKDALRYAIERLATLASWPEEECGEPLIQATPQPTRRVQLARYLLRRHPRLFDFMILEEAHMFAHGNSAQSKAAQRLLSLCMRRRLPVVALTGSVMNGFARSLFVLLWHLSSAFRAEFAFNDAGEFERRYGFLVQVVEQLNEKRERVVFGTHSDRITTRERTTGAAPGVLPTAILRFLLAMGVTVQLSDLEVALPPCHERIVYVEPTKAQNDNASRLLGKVLGAIAADRFKSGLAGKLFGALGHLPRYYDHATNDTGNRDDGSWTVGYPMGTENVSSPTLLSIEGLDPSVRLPKEEALVREVRAALADGRNVVVASTRIELGERLTRVLTEDLADLKIKPVFLNAKKVSAKKRRDWVISAKEAGARVLVCNPAALPQGLNVLVGHFTVICMFDDPNNDPTLLRQFRGRFVRIGQTRDVILLLFVYRDTLQDDANDHLQKKRVVAEAADGLDPSAAFAVAGVGEQASFESDLGKALYAKLTG